MAYKFASANFTFLCSKLYSFPGQTAVFLLAVQQHAAESRRVGSGRFHVFPHWRCGFRKRLEKPWQFLAHRWARLIYLFWPKTLVTHVFAVIDYLFSKDTVRSAISFLFLFFFLRSFLYTITLFPLYLFYTPTFYFLLHFDIFLSFSYDPLSPSSLFPFSHPFPFLPFLFLFPCFFFLFLHFPPVSPPPNISFPSSSNVHFPFLLLHCCFTDSLTLTVSHSPYSSCFPSQIPLFSPSFFFSSWLINFLVSQTLNSFT